MVTILQKANTQVEHVNITATELAEECIPLQLYKLMWNSNFVPENISTRRSQDFTHYIWMMFEKLSKNP